MEEGNGNSIFLREESHEMDVMFPLIIIHGCNLELGKSVDFLLFSTPVERILPFPLCVYKLLSRYSELAVLLLIFPSHRPNWRALDQCFELREFLVRDMNVELLKLLGGSWR
jgi:hypothetical protein